MTRTQAKQRAIRSLQGSRIIFKTRRGKNLTFKQLINRTFKYTLQGYRAPHPQEIQLEITNLCNLRCRTCGREEFLSKFGSLSFSDFCLLMSRLDLAKVKRFHFGGYGEPLLNKEITNMVAHIPPHIFKTTNTNLYHSKESFLVEFAKSGIDEINISLDGFDKQTYEKIRIGSSWEQLIENINIVYEHKINKCKVNLHSVVYDENIDSFIDNIESLLCEIKVDSIRFVGMKSHGAKAATEEGKLFFNCNQIKGLKEIANKFVTEISFNENKPLRSCLRPFHQIYILFDGNVTPCCNIVDDQFYSFGNLLETDRINDVWNSRHARLFRKSLINDNPHQLCGTLCGLGK